MCFWPAGARAKAHPYLSAATFYTHTLPTRTPDRAGARAQAERAQRRPHGGRCGIAVAARHDHGHGGAPQRPHHRARGRVGRARDGMAATAAARPPDQ
eukprot:363140-Chlamydomonas_euryale.AAC.3